jgi:hypothetical protein
MRIGTIAAMAAVVLLATGSTALAQVQLSIRDGRVTLVAKDATVRQILTEWARVGQTRFINAERIPGGPISVQLTDVPEQQALDLLLRNLSGYVAAPRPTAVSSLSRYDRILVMPTAAAQRQPLAAAAAVSPVAQRPGAAPTEDTADDEPVRDNIPATTVVAPARGPVFTTLQQPPGGGIPATAVGPNGVPLPTGVPLPNGVPVPNGATPPNGTPQFVPFVPPPDQPPASQSPTAPTSPGGVSRPGMIVPPPAQPAQPQPGR